MDEPIVIVGAGHAGTELAVALRQSGYEGGLVLIGSEPHLPYQRPPLSKAYLIGEMGADRIAIRPRSFFEQHQVQLRLATSVVAIDRESREISLSDGQTLRYRKLALALGSRARPLPVPGADLAGVYYLRTLAESDELAKALKSASRLAVIGGGYIGLEIAASARKRSLQVTIVEREARLLARVASPPTAEKIEYLHIHNGNRVMLGETVSALIDDGGGRVSGLALAGGERIAADVVVVGVGVVANQELAADSGLDVGNGIIVDEYCRTSDRDIYAIGDVVEQPDLRFGRIRLESIQNATQQAKTCAANMLGQSAAHDAVPWFWSDQFEAKLQSAGLHAGYDQLVERPGRDVFSGSAWMFKGGRFICVEAINDPRAYMQGKRWLQSHLTPQGSKLCDPTVDLKTISTV